MFGFRTLLKKCLFLYSTFAVIIEEKSSGIKCHIPNPTWIHCHVYSFPSLQSVEDIYSKIIDIDFDIVLHFKEAWNSFAQQSGYCWLHEKLCFQTATGQSVWKRWTVYILSNWLLKLSLSQFSCLSKVVHESRPTVLLVLRSKAVTWLEMPQDNISG